MTRLGRLLAAMTAAERARYHEARVRLEARYGRMLLDAERLVLAERIRLGMELPA